MTNFSKMRLYFINSGRWIRLPEWAEYFIGIGKQFSLIPQPDRRIVTAIVVPTRAFAAAFTALGVVVSDAENQSNQASNTAHFEKLFDFPPGTPVIYQPNQQEGFKGILQSPEDCHGQLYVRVQVQSKEGGALTYLIDESKALQIQLSDHAGQLPKKKIQTRNQPANDFVNYLLGENDSSHIGFRPRPICTLIGRKNVLEHEICKAPLAVYVNGNQFSEGRLQDILRVDQFATKTQACSSVLIPVSSRSPSNKITSSPEMGVVFDGAHGFLKWGDIPSSRNQVIILDRTETYFNDAISAVNTRFSQNRVDSGAALPGCEPPPGGEVLTFWETAK